MFEIIEKQVQPKCSCEVQAYEKEIAEAEERKRRGEIERRFGSVLGDRFATYTFDRFGNRPGAERALDLAQRFANKFELANGKGLLIWGEPGNGKSHLAGAVFHAVKVRGHIPVFQSVPELLGRIRSTFNRNTKEQESEIMNAVLRCDLLILDDIGAEKLSDWVLDVIFRIIDGRYRTKRATMFTTNFSLGKLGERFWTDTNSVEQQIASKRIIDRIVEMSVIVENKAESYRGIAAEESAGWM